MKVLFKAEEPHASVLLDILEEQYPDVGIESIDHLSGILTFRSRDHYSKVSSDLENTFEDLVEFTIKK